MASDGSLTAIVLAAGQSQRMGEDNKLLLDVGGRPVLVRVLTAFVEAGVPDIIVVTGAERERVMETASTAGPMRFVHNAEYASGMASSIRCGVQSACSETGGYAICPGDLPLLRADTVHRLVQTFDAQQEPRIVRPRVDSRPGHPVIFGRSFREDLLQLQGDQGGREILQRREHATTHLNVEDEGVLRDVDTSETLRVVRQRIARASTSSLDTPASDA